MYKSEIKGKSSICTRLCKTTHLAFLLKLSLNVTDSLIKKKHSLYTIMCIYFIFIYLFLLIDLFIYLFFFFGISLIFSIYLQASCIYPRY